MVLSPRESRLFSVARGGEDLHHPRYVEALVWHRTYRTGEANKRSGVWRATKGSRSECGTAPQYNFWFDGLGQRLSSPLSMQEYVLLQYLSIDTCNQLQFLTIRAESYRQSLQILRKVALQRQKTTCFCGILYSTN